MSILTVLLVLLLFAGSFYLIWRFVPNGTLKTFLLVAVAIILIVYLLTATGVWGSMARVDLD